MGPRGSGSVALGPDDRKCRQSGDTSRSGRGELSGAVAAAWRPVEAGKEGRDTLPQSSLWWLVAAVRGRLFEFLCGLGGLGLRIADLLGHARGGLDGLGKVDPGGVLLLLGGSCKIKNCRPACVAGYGRYRIRTGRLSCVAPTAGMSEQMPVAPAPRNSGLTARAVATNIRSQWRAAMFAPGSSRRLAASHCRALRFGRTTAERRMS